MATSAGIPVPHLIGMKGDLEITGNPSKNHG